MGRWFRRWSTLWLILGAACFALALAMSVRMAWFAARWKAVDQLAMAVMSLYVIFLLLFQWQLGRERGSAGTAGQDEVGAGAPDAAGAVGQDELAVTAPDAADDAAAGQDDLGGTAPDAADDAAAGGPH